MNQAERPVIIGMPVHELVRQDPVVHSSQVVARAAHCSDADAAARHDAAEHHARPAGTGTTASSTRLG